ncbi:hypothetical protein K461DRAFT_296809 [Myriangium duriaei CBS 260.36]|uniref:Uncharacterized protein n=1 Tax=Myriangium duriaei CBS 260.36 TaxID=1168546 RepID=A0A9P4ISR5_9PEZI|nr:hypothetical protein K461DRAFT_296809 [Myriangium duriaei CBS 260.36]
MGRAILLFDCIAAAAVLTFLVSLAELATSAVVQHRLKASLKSIYNSNGLGVAISDGTRYLPPRILDAPEQYFVTHFSAAELAAAVLTLISSLLTIGWIIHARMRSSRPVRGLSSVAAGFACIITIVTFGIMGWVFDVTDRQGQLDLLPPTPPDGSGGSDIGIVDISWSNTITWETYLCGLAPITAPYNEGGFFGSTCKYSRASRWTLVPLCILSLVMTVLLWISGRSQSRAQVHEDKIAPGRGDSIEMPETHASPPRV